ncbi:EamA family transporter, partial [Clostridium novyi]
ATLTMFPSIFINNNISTEHTLFLILGGFCFTLGQIFLTIAYKSAPASEISMFDYLGLLFAGIYGFVLFKEVPDILSIIGYFIIVVISILSILFNKINK